VEKILDVRLNRKYHSEEYKVQLMGMVLKHTTKDETERPVKKAKRSDVQKHDTKRGKVRKEEKNSESSDNSRKKGQ